jgi:hypothetical protein
LKVEPPLRELVEHLLHSTFQDIQYVFQEYHLDAGVLVHDAYDFVEQTTTGSFLYTLLKTHGANVLTGESSEDHGGLDVG